jgi:hypothetical protein
VGAEGDNWGVAEANGGKGGTVEVIGGNEGVAELTGGKGGFCPVATSCD